MPVPCALSASLCPSNQFGKNAYGRYGCRDAGILNADYAQ